jgi:hypothetical protein
MEAEATDLVKRDSDYVQIEEPTLPDYGAQFSSTDFDITNIPWDSENRESLPSDVLWGYVSEEASKSLFLKSYTQLALSLPDSIGDMDPNSDTSPPAINLPVLDVVTRDDAVETLKQTGYGILGAAGQQINPLDADNVKQLRKTFNEMRNSAGIPKDVDPKSLSRAQRRANILENFKQKRTSLRADTSNAFDNLFDKKTGKIGRMTTKMEAISKSTLKKGGPIRKLKHAIKKALAKIGLKIMKAFQRFMQKKLIKAIVLRVSMWATMAGLAATTILSLGATGPAAGAWGLVISIIEITLTAIDIISIVAGAFLPVILEKLLDGEGVCPAGSDTIDNIIKDEVAYNLFTTFVPLGDLVDLFGPYLCWDGAEPKLKQKVFEPTYLQDNTLSLMYHNWAARNMTPRGNTTIPKTAEVMPGYTCINKVCRKDGCLPGTAASSAADPMCNQITKKTDIIAPTLKTEDQMKTALGVPTTVKWTETTLGDLFEPYNQGNLTCSAVADANAPYNWETGSKSTLVCTGTGERGCGCIRATKRERAIGQCPNRYELNEADLMCYKMCDDGFQRIGSQCVGTTASYMRDTINLGNSKISVRGYLMPETLDGLNPADKNATQPGFSEIKPYTDFCNFASPVMLDRMAQFYYDYSYANPDIVEVDFSVIGDTPENRKLVDLSGGPVLLQWDYITRFYGVIASSELSCDVACEIRTITYNPITGASFTEERGCSNVDTNQIPDTFQQMNTMCYRRFYFIKGRGDPNGLFTVTGCTNSDGTAPDAEVNSWDEGVQYVPSLPKTFKQCVQAVPFTMSPTDYARMGVGVAAAGGTELMGTAGQLLLGPAIQMAAGKVDQQLAGGDAASPAGWVMRQLNASASRDDAEAASTYIKKVLDGGRDVFYVETKAEYRKNVNGVDTDAFAYINHGPIVEQAVGQAPIVERCKNAILTEQFCAHKFILRDTIRRYELENPTKRVKQVDIIEPRGTVPADGKASDAKHGCYYRWKEVNYDADTNLEDARYVTKEVLYKYRMGNLKTCVYEPEALITDVKEVTGEYPLRTLALEGNTAYMTRRKITKPVRFVRIQGGENPLQISQIVIYNTDYVNVAQGRIPTASPARNLNGAIGEATYATDGNAMTRAFPSVYHSADGNAFFEIDLGREEFIHSIVLYNRQDKILPLKSVAEGFQVAARRINTPTFVDTSSSATRASLAAPDTTINTTTGSTATQIAANTSSTLSSINLTPTTPTITATNTPATTTVTNANGTVSRVINVAPAFIPYSPTTNLEITSMWNGYALVCLDGARAQNYGPFPLVGVINGEPQFVQRFGDFPPLDLQRRRPFNSFAVPRSLPPETTLGGKNEVFYVGGGFPYASDTNYTKAAAASVCARYGAQVATMAQLTAAQQNKADWCASGWVADNAAAVYPITTTLRPGCGSGTTGVKSYTHSTNLAGVNCFGPRPPNGTPLVLPFNATSWDDKLNTAPPLCPTKCSDRSVIEGLVGEFNQANPSAKIVKVLKAWTSKPNRCDFEVEMMRLDTGGKKTFAKETTFIEVARQGNTCTFTRVRDGLATLNSGTYIDTNTPELEFKNGDATVKGLSLYEAVTTGVRSVYARIIDTIKTQKPLEKLKEEAVKTETDTRAVLSYVAANQPLRGCTTKCSDPSIMAAIGARYNADRGVLNGQFGAERSTMKRILRSVGGTDTECDVLFEEEYEYYDDTLYPPTEKATRAKAVRVKMVDAGGCRWGVATGADAIRDISGAAIGLLTTATEAAGNPYVVPSCAVDCRAPANLAAVKAAAAAVTNTTNLFVNFRQVTQSFRNGSSICEYKVVKDVTTRDPNTKTSSTASDVDTYISATFKLATTGSSCAYTLDALQEFPLDDIETTTDKTTGEDIYYLGSKVLQPPILFGYDPDTAVSPLVNATPVNM